MCGLAGVFGRVDFTCVETMLERIEHRGPDGTGIAKIDVAVHGHVRLALLDLSSASSQPFWYEGGLLSFNGEIWNHAAVRAELRALGRSFATTGDTEVLAAALTQWGIDAALPKLRGMFSFAWSKDGQHALARDRYGKIPLYVLRRADSWEWASERKAWTKPASGAAHALPPGTILDLVSGKMRTWYRVPSSSDDVESDLLGILRESVAERLAADAPVCVLVSGGLDSSLILALAREQSKHVVAYTSVLRDDSDDLLCARRLCSDLGVSLREVHAPAPTTETIAQAMRCIEISSKAQIEIALMCLPLAQRIASDGFKACLTGEGADELFGGYGNMCIQASGGGDAKWREIRLAQLEKMSRGNFVRCNKAFMSSGVEARLPFMSHRLVELALSLGKTQCPPNKKLLKQASSQIVPAWVIRRTKDTFQGASGMAESCARVIASPTRFYNAESRAIFGAMVTS